MNTKLKSLFLLSVLCTFGSLAQATTSCEIVESTCPNYPSYVGTFGDNYDGSGSNESVCLARALQYQQWCAAKTAVTANFISNGVIVASHTAPAISPPPSVYNYSCSCVSGSSCSVSSVSLTVNGSSNVVSISKNALNPALNLPFAGHSQYLYKDWTFVCNSSGCYRTYTGPTINQYGAWTGDGGQDPTFLDLYIPPAMLTGAQGQYIEYNLADEEGIYSYPNAYTCNHN